MPDIGPWPLGQGGAAQGHGLENRARVWRRLRRARDMRPRMENKEYVLRGFIRLRPSGRFVGVCLRPNLVVEADSREEAFEKLKDLVGAYRADAVIRGWRARSLHEATCAARVLSGMAKNHRQSACGSRNSATRTGVTFGTSFAGSCTSSRTVRDPSRTRSGGRSRRLPKSRTAYRSMPSQSALRADHSERVRSTVAKNHRQYPTIAFLHYSRIPTVVFLPVECFVVAKSA